MIRIINKVYSEPVKEISETSTDNYYGVINGRYKGFVTSFNDEYIVLSVTRLTEGNCWNVRSDDFNEFLIELLERDFGVFEFNTHNELFKWLAE